jgi:hypothetical protein
MWGGDTVSNRGVTKFREPKSLNFAKFHEILPKFVYRNFIEIILQGVIPFAVHTTN